MTEQDTERTRIILASELHLTSLTEQEQAEADEEAAHLLVEEIPPLEADGDAGGGGDDPGGAKGMIQDSIKTGKVKIAVALELARSGYVARAAAVNTALLLDAVGAARPISDVDHQECEGFLKNIEQLRLQHAAVPVMDVIAAQVPLLPPIDLTPREETPQEEHWRKERERAKRNYCEHKKQVSKCNVCRRSK